MRGRYFYFGNGTRSNFTNNSSAENHSAVLRITDVSSIIQFVVPLTKYR